MAQLGVRQTEQKAAVREALERSAEFIGAQDLFAVMKGEGSSIGLATVYRNLNEMARAGQADVMQGHGGQLFRFCNEGHHHHLVCIDCGKTVEFSAPVEEWIDSVAGDNDFAVVNHVFDVFGRCSDCQAKVERA